MHINGRILSANVGNFHPFTAAYTYSLADVTLARLIHKKFAELSPDICLLQEVWTFSAEVLGDDYEWIGQNDTIAIKKSFGHLLRNTFRSHSLRFKKSASEPANPNLKDPVAVADQEQKLTESPYNGESDSSYGIPADFDVTSVIAELQSGQKILLVNVHVISAPWHDHLRAPQLQAWIIDDCLPRARDLTNGRILIGGDFNHDEDRQASGQSAEKMRSILSWPGMNDAAGNDKRITTNLPKIVKGYRFDHIYGTATFSNYQLHQSLTDKDLQEFKRNHRMTWWMYLDHQSISSYFEFK
jgi:hypothetical protein